jgi:hypothetical protein
LKHLASLKHLAKEVICIVMWLKHPCNFSLILGNEPVQFSFNPNKWICVSSSIIRFISTRGGETFDNYIPCRACWGITNQWCREALNAVWKYLLVSFKVWTPFTTSYLSYHTPSFDEHYHKQKTK